MDQTLLQAQEFNREPNRENPPGLVLISAPVSVDEQAEAYKALLNLLSTYDIPGLLLGRRNTGWMENRFLAFSEISG